MTRNTPDFVDFIAAKLGTRRWYTRARPAPTKSKGKVYIRPIAYKAIQAEYEDTFGVPAW